MPTLSNHAARLRTVVDTLELVTGNPATFLTGLDTLAVELEAARDEAERVVSSAAAKAIAHAPGEEQPF